MKLWLKLSILGLITYVGFVLIQFPANNAYFMLEDLLVEKKIPVELYEIKGSIWQGSATRVVYNGKAFNNFVWDFQPLALLKGKLSLAFSYKNKDSFANAVASINPLGTIEVENTQASMSAQEILALAKIPAVKLGGQFDLDLVNLQLVDKKISSVNGRLVWSDAQSVFPQKLVLGDMFANLSTADDGAINVTLGDGGGPLELSGKANLLPDGKYDVSSLMAAREGRESVLGQSLGFFAQYNGEGKAEFKRSGNIAEFKFLFK